VSELQIEVGKNIKRIRIEKGFSQEEFALRAKIDRSYMGRIERGEANITIKVIATIAKTLDCEPADILKSKV